MQPRGRPEAPFFLIQAVADHIRDNGRIINVSTGFTRVAAPTHPAYAASKGALETLTLALAPEFGARGITVNAVMPGVTETDMNAAWITIPQARAGAQAMSVFSRIGGDYDERRPTRPNVEISRLGGAPNMRVYSRLNCEALS
ncbi:hypothetical protein UC34_14085 [Pandoraea vervacti]|uniref:Short-chain dehydrogenase n=1 Tax=Pandoraea vervacti TaxID=656178 RepID=A0ABM5SZB8_9BURK|nr:SDR family oxidoreductase [Pandoraea vervacti]AJP57806.1 hypothetical protein UC34_14085 [Pandoraea vervacti]